MRMLLIDPNDDNSRCVATNSICYIQKTTGRKTKKFFDFEMVMANGDYLRFNYTLHSYVAYLESGDARILVPSRG